MSTLSDMLSAQAALLTKVAALMAAINLEDETRSGTTVLNATDQAAVDAATSSLTTAATEVDAAIAKETPPPPVV